MVNLPKIVIHMISGLADESWNSAYLSEQGFKRKTAFRKDASKHLIYDGVSSSAYYVNKIKVSHSYNRNARPSYTEFNAAKIFVLTSRFTSQPNFP
jgi:hypothetical protein